MNAGDIGAKPESGRDADPPLMGLKTIVAAREMWGQDLVVDAAPSGAHLRCQAGVRPRNQSSGRGAGFALRPGQVWGVVGGQFGAGQVWLGSGDRVGQSLLGGADRVTQGV